MILNYRNWKKLNEQAPTETITQTFHTPTAYAWTTDPESLKIMTAFNTEFIPSILGDVDGLTISQYISKLNALTPDQFNSAIQFFKQKGYDQPNDKIKKFQEDLMNSTDYKTFTTSDDKTKPFNDGIFGRATSAAIVKFMVSKLAVNTDRDTVTVGELKKKFKMGNQVVPAAKIKTGEDVKTGTGTQTLK